ncbi:hypothetical protein [Ascidiaceihabitans sp.]|uniref:hypothetical protein n=1 Tax=Ascidiaceihabitans sp. TaxID=1872644 RepID=UPI003296EDE7
MSCDQMRSLGRIAMVHGRNDIRLTVWQTVLIPHLTDLTAQSLIDGSRTLQPRLYSISSSPQKHPDEVPLTIGEMH